MFVHDFMDGTRSHIARHEISVLRIPLLQKIPAIIFRNRIRIALIAGDFRNPHAPAFSARRLRHQAQLVFTGNRRWMNLDELAIRVVAALLVQSRLRRSRADHGIGGLPKIAPMPPVAMMIASAGKVRTSMLRRSMAQMPRQTRLPSSTADRNSQCSYFATLPSDS